MRRVADQHPARPAPGAGLRAHQRPGSAVAGQLQIAGGTAGGLHQRASELGGSHGEQRVGARVGHRPDQRIRRPRLRCVKGQQRQHVGRTEPLARGARMRPRAGQPRGDCTVPVRPPVERHPVRLAAGRSLALADGGQRGGRPVGVGRADRGDVRRKPHRRRQFAFEHGGVDDPRQLADALLPRRELERGARGIALHAHLVHRGGGLRRQRVPHLEPAQQGHRAGVERIGAHIGAARRGRRRRLGHQGHAQPDAGQRQGQRMADQTGSTHLHVIRFHYK